MIQAEMAAIEVKMAAHLTSFQLKKLKEVLRACDETIAQQYVGDSQVECKTVLDLFLEAKRMEGCSNNTIAYYKATVGMMFSGVKKSVLEITTDDLRKYLSDYQSKRGSSKVTIDNIRRILSSFFGWLEDEDYIIKSPVRKIRHIRQDVVIREIISDEAMELLRDACSSGRDLAIVDLLASTGMRAGELVKLNRTDINFQERECVVIGKGNKQRLAYFDARTKVHLQNYLAQRSDNNPALFVSLALPCDRLMIGGVEARLKDIGSIARQQNVHPHKFRRTFATRAIDKGMPIEQVQRLLGHAKIETTMRYALVNETNVRNAHRKIIA